MKNYLQGQLNFLRGGWSHGAYNTNPAGMWQATFENMADAAWDDVLGPALRVGGRAALLGGLIGAGLWLTNNNDVVGGEHIGSAAGGAILGGLAGGAITSAAAHRHISNLAKTSTAIKGGAIGTGALRFGTPILGALAGAAIGGVGASFGAGAPVLGIAGIVGMMALNKAGIDPTLPFRGAVRAMGGGAGIAGAALHGARAVAGAAWTGVKATELAARAVLTGGVRGVQGPLDSWFPYFRNTPINTIKAGEELDTLFRDKLLNRGVSAAKATEMATLKAGTKVIDPRKYAPNPRIVRRLTGFGALFAVGSAVHEAMQPQIAPPTQFFDGRYMRHVNDLGTGGGYGMGIMGRNSSLNFSYQEAARTITNAF